jgi:hypothetical protein
MGFLDLFSSKKSVHSRKVKVVYGVTHHREDQFQLIREKLEERGPRRVALEVTKEGLKFGFLNEYFTKIVDYLRKRNIEIIPLKSKDDQLYQQAVFLVVEVAKGERTLEELRDSAIRYKDLHESTSFPYMQHDEQESIKDNTQVYSMVKGLLKQGNNTIEKAEALWNDASLRLEREMIRRIRESLPDVVVVGFRHAIAIKKELPPQYSFSILSSAPMGRVFD